MLLKELIPGKPQTHSAYEKGIEKKYIAILSEAFEQASELSNLENLKTKVYEKSLLSLSGPIYTGGASSISISSLPSCD